MRRQLQGIALIMFGMLLGLIAMIDPVLSDTTLRFVSDLLALIMGILGLVFVFTKDNSDKS